MIEAYHLSNESNIHLSKNFKVKEFKCKDGNDLVLVDDKLVEILQQIRNAYGKPVLLNSAYRTPTYNVAVDGAAGSYHMIGMAADIRITGISPASICSTAEQLMKYGGIIRYDNFVHIDTRPVRYRAIKNSNGTFTKVNKF